MDQYRALLPDYIRHQSISTDPAFQGGITATVAWLKNIFQVNGFTVTIVEGYDNPIVVAHYEADPAYQTCLIYGHYDVQPAAKEDGWRSDPFVATERDGRFYCRGAIDNKGQNLVHIVSIIDLIKAGKLGYNIKFMLEGNEETGSAGTSPFITDHADLIKADFVMISDGELPGNLPAIEVGFRGLMLFTLTLTTSETDLHSGIYGASAPNAAHELAKLINSFYDADNHVTIPEFYEQVDDVSDEARQNNARLPFSEESYQQTSGTKGRLSEPGYDFHTQTTLRPSIQIIGMHAGYTGEGYKNSIPGKAVAKVNIRTVQHQNARQIERQFKQYVTNHLPEYVAATIESGPSVDPVKLEVANPFVQKARTALQTVYGTEPVYRYVGGTIGLVTYLHAKLGMPMVMVPLANEDCHMHGVNENFAIEFIEKGLAFSHAFFERTK